MATAQDFQNLRARFDAATTAVAGVIRDLKAKLETGGLTATEEAEALASLGSVADQLEAMGKPDVPLPEVPPAEEPAGPGTEVPADTEG